ncbi:hypothetical protein Kpol_1052p29 [Vanderwaltozyma polyspora DSM 70294]|uniref:Autophagy-related protein 17 n=1 Tax=Vanderwaltozyma polyspora (strain ATCC 22028 / DSM 70294 / BCRC 21397 / CBS 2163 / NBRC 10782 / NRRL Y-8283 / UCD 57-17) TaxID=436907 RepID=ATG17_VANPO|nr:uncharacterized protein Kpol_1052p29 [Vanderwaltozyma polyspora DSM 70294]A7TM40.1 RecName: Full=Autophagy-related protein 17 [Vanderwaltozyma polyspora DSM 70294]EDO16682.1 hypothetical protein Kpol_1052p29 [Vanderwaltozyma polyspora DSM 70294]
MKIERFVNASRKTLVEAQVLCQDANSRISNARSSFSHWERSISKIRFLLNCLKNQGSFIKNCILKVGIEENLIEKEWTQSILVDLAKELKYWNSKINEQVRVLDSIENILDEDTKSESKNLGYFVSRDNLDILEKRLKEIPNVKYHIDNIRGQYNTMFKKVSNYLINKRLKSVQEYFLTNFENDSDDIKKLTTTLPSKLVSLEHDLADYLSSITNHYDQSKLLQTLKPADPDYTDLLEVVKNDNSELDGIVTLLRETVDEVDETLKTFLGIFNEIELKQKECNKLLFGVIEEFKINHEYLLIFNDISSLIDNFKETCIEDINNTRSLCIFYQKFEIGYQNLLFEIERRKTVAQKMTDIIKNCELELSKINEEDQKNRSEFLKLNGDYLPENIWPGKIDDFSPLYSLEYSIKEI